MALLSPTSRVASYNGAVFQADASTFTMSMRGIPDKAGRTTVCDEYTFKVDGIVKAANQVSGSTDAQMNALRSQLRTYGGELHLDNAGYGDFAVNVPGKRVRDVAWGPKPELTDFEPLGGGMAARVVWTCKVRLPCSDAVSYEGLMEWTYTLDFDRDYGGRSTRTYVCTAQIALTRESVGSSRVKDSIDRWQEILTPTVPPGFYREKPGSFHLAANKTEGTLTVIDVEWPSTNYPPAGITKAEANHSVRNLASGNSNRWIATITASYEVARGVEPALACAYFTDLVFERIGVTNRRPDNSIMFLDMRIEQPEIYGVRSFHGSLSYSFYSLMPDLLKSTGLFSPVQNSNYNTWKTSMMEGPWHPRGNARLKFNPLNSDAILDLCLPSKPVQLKPGGGLPTGPGGPRPGGGGGGNRPGFGLPDIKNAVPTAQLSWFVYVLWLRVEVDDGVAISTPLPKKAPKPSLVPSAQDILSGITTANPGQGLLLNQMGETIGGTTGGLQSVPGNPIGGQPPAGTADFPDAGYPPETPGHIVQYRVPPAMWITVYGYAVRAGYPIPVPKLVRVGGVKVIACNREGIEFWEQGTVGNFFGVPLACLRYRQRYFLPTIPKGPIGLPGNPVFG